MFDFNNLKFLDSISFMNPDDSLEKLVKSLRGDKAYDSSKFKITQNYFYNKYPNMTENDFKLIITKGIYPYEYMDSFEKFNETSLPQLKNFIQV